MAGGKITPSDVIYRILVNYNKHFLFLEKYNFLIVR